jgi:hypothetical protein
MDAYRKLIGVIPLHYVRIGFGSRMKQNRYGDHIRIFTKTRSPSLGTGWRRERSTTGASET